MDDTFKTTQSKTCIEEMSKYRDLSGLRNLTSDSNKKEKKIHNQERSVMFFLTKKKCVI